jgi:Domain of unknown function (DUF4411)
MSNTDTIYCLDASALIEAATRSYPQDTFETLWERIDGLIADGRIVSPHEVLLELKRKDDELHEWAKVRESLFRDLDEDLQTATRKVLSACPDLINPGNLKSNADPFVVGLAVAEGASVVTQETWAGGLSKPKIPNACKEVGVPWMNMLSFIQAEGWKF